MLEIVDTFAGSDTGQQGADLALTRSDRPLSCLSLKGLKFRTALWLGQRITHGWRIWHRVAHWRIDRLRGAQVAGPAEVAAAGAWDGVWSGRHS
jgi:hypothetical protein